MVHLTTGVTLCTVLALAGCSSSGGAAASQPPPSLAGSTAPAGSSPASGTTTPQANPTLASILGSGGPLDVSKLCAAVPAADIQKLFKAPAPTVVANPGECDWGTGGITVDIYFNDANKQLYDNGAVSPATAKTLPGVGDLAQWQQPVPGATVPFLVAHKGTTTVSVSPGLDVSQTTMTYTGSSPFFKIPSASAAQYAAEEGQICTDIFAAANA